MEHLSGMHVFSFVLPIAMGWEVVTFLTFEDIIFYGCCV
jgi:hypothetical protein